ncbi:3-phosphoshikimate 1-carboxyvinyltransferase [Psittacicella melopsittaci]|uniref:3-phosphoshikimate 1-carboxyvinyltransferase n=1 Tax=Psittacicella melopsittaci TaxID=2028576 RepID=A0A3A1Y504_9GAMM|nr:3-phosphoshikimate 1-carboxyvinyltransferase [Psittacicella melopsittaci]RIY32460.1 3-phosphoshikimate 1-carboxyvinyltransferase [Psittacicella melopsittaci]
MEKLTLKSSPLAHGTITIPGSKSLSNRLLLLSALAKGTTKVTNLLKSDDVYWMLKALETLGIKYQVNESQDQALVEGNGGIFTLDGKYDLFLGNAGTAFRPLIAALAFNRGDAEFTIHGEPRMHERPVGDLVDALNAIGCEIEYLNEKGYAPLRIVTKKDNKSLDPISINIPGNISSQFLTSILMVAPVIGTQVTINLTSELVSKPYIDITLNCMQKFNVEVEQLEAYKKYVIKPQSYLSPEKVIVEGDASSASYFLLAGAIGGDVTVQGIDMTSTQGDKNFVYALEAMGAKISFGEGFIRAQKNTELEQQTGYPLKAVDLNLNHIPDAAMGIAIAALFCPPGSKTIIRDIYNWRVKETDRLAAMANELKAVGAQVVEGEDYLEVVAPEKLKAAEIKTYNDHRMAMCFSLVSLNKQGVEVTILDPKCTSKTFPTYFTEFNKIHGK